MRQYFLYVLAGIILAVAGTSWYIGHVNSTHPAPWPMTGGDSAHRSATSAVFPLEAKQLWSVPLPQTGPYFGRPVIWKDGTVYVTVDGKVIAIDPAGKQKWVWNSESPISTLALGRQGTVYALGRTTLNALNPDGTVAWQYELDIKEPQLLVVGQGGVIYVTGSDYLYAISSTGTRKWRFKADKITAGPAEMPDGKLLVTIEDDLYLLTRDGDTVWHRKYEEPVSPLGIVVGPDSHIYIKGRENIVLDRDGNPLYRSTATGGSIAVAVGKGFVQDGLTRFDNLWRTQNWSALTALPTSVAAAYPIIDRQGNTLVVVAGSNAQRTVALVLLDAKGQERWRWTAAGSITAPSVGADGRIFYIGQTPREGLALFCIGQP